MKKLHVLAVAMGMALVSVAFAQAAQPQPPTDKPAGERPRLDANGDGAIDKAEAAKFPRLAEKFDELDKNRDGKLSKDELPFAVGRGGGRKGPRHPGQRNEGGFGFHGDLDTDKDGRISKAEAQAAHARAGAEFEARFAQRDVNKDGYIDRKDFEARFAERRKECFDKADADHNGQLSRAEFDGMGRCGPGGRFGHPPPGPEGGPPPPRQG